MLIGALVGLLIWAILSSKNYAEIRAKAERYHGKVVLYPFQIALGILVWTLGGALIGAAVQHFL